MINLTHPYGLRHVKRAFPPDPIITPPNVLIHKPRSGAACGVLHHILSLLVAPAHPGIAAATSESSSTVCFRSAAPPTSNASRRSYHHLYLRHMHTTLNLDPVTERTTPSTPHSPPPLWFSDCSIKVRTRVVHCCPRFSRLLLFNPCFGAHVYTS